MCNHSSGGANGWNVDEMNTWSEFCFAKLADMLHDVEASGGDWPASNCQSSPRMSLGMTNVP